MTLPNRLRIFLDRCRRGGLTIAVANGCFDVIHAGHVELLFQARMKADRLIVAVNDDDSVRSIKGPTRPVNPIGDRIAVLQAIRWVDVAIPFSGPDPAELIREIRPDVLVKGADWRGKPVAGSQFAGRLAFVELVAGRSTTEILSRGRSA